MTNTRVAPFFKEDNITISRRRTVQYVAQEFSPEHSFIGDFKEELAVMLGNLDFLVDTPLVKRVELAKGWFKQILPEDSGEEEVKFLAEMLIDEHLREVLVSVPRAVDNLNRLQLESLVMAVDSPAEFDLEDNADQYISVLIGYIGKLHSELNAENERQLLPGDLWVPEA